MIPPEAMRRTVEDSRKEHPLNKAVKDKEAFTSAQQMPEGGTGAEPAVQRGHVTSSLASYLSAVFFCTM